MARLARLLLAGIAFWCAQVSVLGSVHAGTQAGTLVAAERAIAIGKGDESAIRGAVRLQIEALVNDDAERAFALATQDTRNRLGSPARFLQIIKEQYDPVYRHRRALYQRPQVVLGKVYQVVRLTDLDSHVWAAIYLMHKDGKGVWRIDGCQLVETRAVAI